LTTAEEEDEEDEEEEFELAESNGQDPSGLATTKVAFKSDSRSAPHLDSVTTDSQRTFSGPFVPLSSTETLGWASLERCTNGTTLFDEFGTNSDPVGADSKTFLNDTLTGADADASDAST
jgi:hypothetical protein